MKFPLKERPFDRVQLSPERYDELERLADAVVDATLKEFDEFVHVHNRVLNPKQWKPVKKRENVTVYKELTAKQDRVFGPLGQRNETLALTTLQLPKLLAIGTVHGNMYDMMLGTALHDAASVLVKSSYVDDALVDCTVLNEMRHATPDDPFRYVALKWIVKAHPSGLNSMVAPRDMVVVQSSGLVPEAGIGYHLLHSVDIPECHSLEPKYSILRSRISTAFIFRQMAADVVEVFVANYVEPNGSAPESVAVLSSAKSMNGSWKAIGCAHNMKLSWILKNKDIYMGSTPHATINTDDKCELCFNKATLGGKLADCGLCDARVCSRCRVSKKLSVANRRLELLTTKHEFCKTCLFRVVNEDSKRVAAELYGGQPIVPWRSTDSAVPDGGYRFEHGLSRGSTATSSSSGWQSHRSHRSYGSHGTSSNGYPEDDAISISSDGSLRPPRHDELVYALKEEPPTSTALVKPFPKNIGSTTTPQSQSRTASTSSAGSAQTKEEFWELYSKMQALQMAAEKTYEITQDNSRKLSHQGP